MSQLFHLANLSKKKKKITAKMTPRPSAPHIPWFQSCSQLHQGPSAISDA